MDNLAPIHSDTDVNAPDAPSTDAIENLLNAFVRQRQAHEACAEKAKTARNQHAVSLAAAARLVLRTMNELGQSGQHALLEEMRERKLVASAERGRAEEPALHALAVLATGGKETRSVLSRMTSGIRLAQELGLEPTKAFPEKTGLWKALSAMNARAKEAMKKESTGDAADATKPDAEPTAHCVLDVTVASLLTPEEREAVSVGNAAVVLQVRDGRLVAQAITPDVAALKPLPAGNLVGLAAHNPCARLVEAAAARTAISPSSAEVVVAQEAPSKLMPATDEEAASEVELLGVSADEIEARQSAPPTVTATSNDIEGGDVPPADRVGNGPGEVVVRFKEYVKEKNRGDYDLLSSHGRFGEVKLKGKLVRAWIGRRFPELAEIIERNRGEEAGADSL